MDIYHKGHPNQHENNQNMSNETKHPSFSMKENHWELRQKHEHKTSVEGKQLPNKY